MAGTGTGRERPPATLDDVARLAGVSRATVSRVVNGADLVAARTVEAVNHAIAELGYRPNRAARALVTGRVGAVAVVVPEADERVFSDPFFPLSYHGAVTAFADVDVQVLLAIPQPGERAAKMVRYLESGHVDGAIVISHHGPELARQLQQGPPVVFVGDPGIPGVPYVELDQHDAAVRATRYLIGRGCRRIATVTGPQDMGAGKERLRGFRSALAEAGLEPAGIAAGDFTAAGGELAATELLALPERCDGIFVASDLMAVGVLRVLHQAGVAVPGEVRLIGFDDSSAALQTEPRLTTMTNPATELTRLAGTMLLELLAGGSPEYPVVLRSELVERESA
jgi:DNA-binding LacI/PurR family transcriptional regulator